jgi:hypothetical protein
MLQAVRSLKTVSQDLLVSVVQFMPGMVQLVVAVLQEIPLPLLLQFMQEVHLQQLITGGEQIVQIHHHCLITKLFITHI